MRRVGAGSVASLCLVLALVALSHGASAGGAEKGGEAPATPVQGAPAAEPAPADATKGPAKAAIGAPPAASDGAKVPDGTKLNLMVRTTVIAVNQANKTGNYSVLRDLATPSFQAANNPAQLAEIFAELRKRNLDLSPVLFYQPKFSSRPAQLSNGMLRVAGLFPSRPQQVHFDLVFEQIQGDWRIFRVGIGAHPAPPPDKPNEIAPEPTMSTAAGGPLPAAPEAETSPKVEPVAPNVLDAEKPEIKIAPAAEPAAKAEKKIPGKLADPPAAKPAEAPAEANGTPPPQPKPKP